MNHVPDFEAIDAENMQKHAQAVEEVKAQAAAAGVEPSLPEPPTPARDAYLAQKERAQKFIEESIDYDDEDTICLDNMAQWNYRVLGNKEKAREYFEKAIELKDDQIDTLWFLSRYDLEEGNTAKALEHLNKALDSRFSPLNYKTKQDFENEIARLKA
jgi:tetratricopeptide (TPR) repeat protein